MGILDKFKVEKGKDLDEVLPEGKYSEECAVCGAQGTDKKWLGQHFHKKCLRKMKKQAKGMI